MSCPARSAGNEYSLYPLMNMISCSRSAFCWGFLAETHLIGPVFKAELAFLLELSADTSLCTAESTRFLDNLTLNTLAQYPALKVTQMCCY